MNELVNIFKQSLSKIGQAPGTLLYTGEKKTSDVKLSFMEYTSDKFKTINIKELGEVEGEKNSIKWLDLRGLSNISLIEEIGKKFKIHRLLLEDILNVNQNPKIEKIEETLFFAWNLYTYNSGKFEKEQISIYFNGDYVITFQENDGDSFYNLKERIEKKQGIIRDSGKEYLVFSILDYFSDHHHQMMADIYDRIEKFENELFNNRSEGSVEEIYRFMMHLVRIKNSLWHSMSIVEELSEYSLENGKKI